MDSCWHRKLQIAEYSDEDIFYSVWINFTRLLLLLKKREKWKGIYYSPYIASNRRRRFAIFHVKHSTCKRFKIDPISVFNLTSQNDTMSEQSESEKLQVT